jgi:hypothetical protein
VIWELLGLFIGVYVLVFMKQTRDLQAAWRPRRPVENLISVVDSLGY